MSARDTTENVTKLWEMYRNGVAYQSALRLSRNLPLFVDMYEGRQWPPPNKWTKDLPRPVINIVKMTVRNKRASILSSRVKVVYRSDDKRADVRVFNDFAAYMIAEMKLPELDKESVHDGVIKGTYIQHFYWDAEAVGKEGVAEGGVRGELLDPLRVVFANPSERDVQKQAWVMLVTRQPVESVRAKADRGVDRESIRPDEAGAEERRYGEGDVEQEGANNCTVITRYFRRNGEVWWEAATKDAVVNRARPLAPDVESARAVIEGDREGERGDAGSLSRTRQAAATAPSRREPSEEGLEGDAPNNAIPDAAGGGRAPLVGRRSRAYLYPIVVGNYEPRQGSIYGIGEVEGLIPNQRAINFMVAMVLLNAQTVAQGKYVVSPTALNGQQITNEPGQVLTDYDTNGNGIRRLQEPVMSGMPLSITDTIMQYTRVCTGTTEVMTGETLGASMSGAAIAQLQSQAALPTDDLRDSFWKFKEAQGRVLAQCYALYYQGKEFVPPVSDAERAAGKEEMQGPLVFNGGDYVVSAMDVVAEATAGARASVAGDITVLDNLLASGKIPLSTYLACYPKDALTNREELIQAVKDAEQGEMAQLSAQLAQYEQELAALREKVAQDARAVDGVNAMIHELTGLKQTLAALVGESTARLRDANAEIAMGNERILEVEDDARIISEELARKVGIMPTKE